MVEVSSEFQRRKRKPMTINSGTVADGMISDTVWVMLYCVRFRVSRSILSKPTYLAHWRKCKLRRWKRLKAMYHSHTYCLNQCPTSPFVDPATERAFFHNELCFITRPELEIRQPKRQVKTRVKIHVFPYKTKRF